MEPGSLSVQYRISPYTVVGIFRILCYSRILYYMSVHSRALGARYCSSSSSGGHPMHPQGEQLLSMVLGSPAPESWDIMDMLHLQAWRQGLARYVYGTCHLHKTGLRGCVHGDLYFSPSLYSSSFLSLSYLKFSLGVYVRPYSSVTRRTCWCPTTLTYNGNGEKALSPSLWGNTGSYNCQILA